MWTPTVYFLLVLCNECTYSGINLVGNKKKPVVYQITYKSPFFAATTPNKISNSPHSVATALPPIAGSPNKAVAGFQWPQPGGGNGNMGEISPCNNSPLSGAPFASRTHTYPEMCTDSKCVIIRSC